MTLYIYRVGWTYPARNPITYLNLQRVLVVLGFQVDRSDRSDPPVRPVGVARPATWSRQVRPLADTGQTCLFNQCQFWSSTYAPLFFGKACVLKNTLLDQNCQRAMNTSAIFCAKDDNNLSAVFCFFFKLMTKQLA